MVRRALKEDLLPVYHFICELESQVPDKKAFERVYLSNLASPVIYYFVAEKDNRVIGFLSLHIQALLHHCGKVAEIQEFILDADSRGQLTGTELFRQAELVSREQQCKVTEVTCNRRRERAHQFYERQGMARTHFKFVK